MRGVTIDPLLRQTRSLPALLTIGSGAAIIAGAWLPWMTFYAGLQRVRGVSGLYGKWLLAAGAVLLAVGAARLWRDHRGLRALSIVLGLGATVGAILLLTRAWNMTHASASMMLVPRLGPGLLLVAFGGAVVLAAAAIGPQEMGRR